MLGKNNLLIRKQHAFQLLESQRYAEAHTELQTLCGQYEKDVDLWRAFAIVNVQLGRLEESIRCFRHVVDIDPSSASSYFNLGKAYQQQRCFLEAVSCYRQALQIAKTFPEAHFHLGQVQYRLGDFSEAEKHFRHAVEAKPDYAWAYDALGTALYAQGKSDKAIESYRKSLELGPNNPNTHFNLGIALQMAGAFKEAIESYRNTVRVNPHHAEAYTKMGHLLQKLSITEEAVASYKEAIRIDPALMDAHNSLSMALLKQGKPAEAIACCERAVQINPNNAGAYNNTGLIRDDRGELEQAYICYQRALEIEPDFAQALHNCGLVRSAQGMLEDAMDFYRRAIDAKKDYIEAHANLLFVMNYSIKDGKTLYAAHTDWAKQYTDLLGGDYKYANSRQVNRPLRIGYVSGDFSVHSVSYFFEPLLLAYNSTNFEIICYSDVLKPDDTTARLKSLAKNWQDISKLTDQQLADRIHSDRIDILVDLAGHTRNNRLRAFARKPAPIQVTYIGYPNTTGMPCMNYRFTDEWADPVGVIDKYYTERLIRLPGGFLCYKPPDHLAAECTRSSQKGREITFGSFNNLAKVTPEVITAWAAILKRLPKARIILKNKSLVDEATCKRYMSLFAKHGVDRKRVELRGIVVSTIGHLQQYNDIDIALDPFPYNGTTTTCEALWMGVPVIILAGQVHAGRVGVSLLSMAGLGNFIAESKQEYIELAIQLAKNPDELSQLHHSLRDNILQSPLCDQQRLMKGIERAYQSIWRTWCKQ